MTIFYFLLMKRFHFVRHEIFLFGCSSQVFVLWLMKKSFEVAQPIGLMLRAELRNKSGLTLMSGSGQMRVWLLQDKM